MYVVVANVATAQRADAGVLAWTLRHSTHAQASLASDLVGLFSPAAFVVWFGLLVGGAVAAGRTRAGLAVGAGLAAAVVTTHLLKAPLAFERAHRADPPLVADAWPSGHATAMAGLLLGLLIVLPPRLRPLTAALGGSLVGAALLSIVALGFHYPSDVLGGVLVASAWSAVALAVSGGDPAPTGAPRPLPPRSRHATG